MNDYRLADEVRIPTSVLHALAAAADRAGEPVAAVVREAGRAAGDEIVRRIRDVVSLTELDADDFWAAVNAETSACGLGTFEWQRGFGGHAELLVRGSPDRAPEPGPAAGGQGLPFTEGLIEGLLGASAEEAVAVVPVAADGGDAVRFVIGSPVALRHVRLRLEGGATPTEALEGL